MRRWETPGEADCLKMPLKDVLRWRRRDLCQWMLKGDRTPQSSLPIWLRRRQINQNAPFDQIWLFCSCLPTMMFLTSVEVIFLSMVSSYYTVSALLSLRASTTKLTYECARYVPMWQRYDESRLTTESSKNSAITLPRMNFSGHVGHVTEFSVECLLMNVT